MERRVVFFASCGICTDIAEGYVIDADEWSESMLSDAAWQFAVSHAESYGIYISEDDTEEDDSSIDDIEGYWVNYCPETHDGALMRGSSGKICWNRL